MKKIMFLFPLFACMSLGSCDNGTEGGGGGLVQMYCDGYIMYVNSDIEVNGMELQNVQWFAGKVDWDYKMSRSQVTVDAGVLDGQSVFLFSNASSSSYVYEVTDSNGMRLYGPADEVPLDRISSQVNACFITPTVTIGSVDNPQPMTGYTRVETDSTYVYYYDMATVGGKSLQSLDWLAGTLGSEYSNAGGMLNVNTARMDGSTVLLFNRVYSAGFYTSAYDSAGVKLDIAAVEEAYRNGTVTDAGYGCLVVEKKK